jgi:hypothetical protein
MGNWLGRGRSLSKKEVELRDKLNSIRIDGVKDKIHERTDKPTHKNKDGKQ